MSDNKKNNTNKILYNDSKNPGSVHTHVRQGCKSSYYRTFEVEVRTNFINKKILRDHNNSKLHNA